MSGSVKHLYSYSRVIELELHVFRKINYKLDNVAVTSRSGSSTRSMNQQTLQLLVASFQNTKI